jgi:spore germination cell wall hydrolase CwlJ-like protein
MKTKTIIFALAMGLLSNLSVNASEIVAATLILEAGGEYATGSMEAVNEVIRNRAAKRKLTTKQVCLQRKQFSCWNSGRIDQLLAKAKRHPRFSEAMAIVKGSPTNYTGGADHYHADYCNPYWASSLKKTCTIGKHLFYK